ncbi:MAG: dTDP-4-dehydrorhamnose 3,5-epimerase family protein [Actinomycetota bacterium]
MCAALPSSLDVTSRPPELVAGDQLHEVRLLRLDRHDDDRGSFTEVFCSHWETGIDPTQWSLVRSGTGVLRGMHVHLRHDEYVMVISGRMSVGLHDLRPGSPTRGRGAVYELHGGEDLCLTFPRGIVHGWLAHEPSVHLQAVSEAHEFYGDDDNNGCHWSDPELGIEWPFEPTVVSPRADAFPSLAELRDSLD